MSREMFGAHDDLSRIVEPGGDINSGGARFDRSIAHLLDKPGGRRPMRRRGGDIVDAGCNEGRTGHTDDNDRRTGAQREPGQLTRALW
jgi:hypothetical protein